MPHCKQNVLNMSYLKDSGATSLYSASTLYLYMLHNSHNTTALISLSFAMETMCVFCEVTDWIFKYYFRWTSGFKGLHITAFYSAVVTTCTTCFNTENSAFCPHLCVLYDSHNKQHQPIGLLRIAVSSSRYTVSNSTTVCFSEIDTVKVLPSKQTLRTLFCVL